ncbi:uncharacterized protein METZ01_LOCUS451108, partial [marine metagenome]
NQNVDLVDRVFVSEIKAGYYQRTVRKPVEKLLNDPPLRLISWLTTVFVPILSSHGCQLTRLRTIWSYDRSLRCAPEALADQPAHAATLVSRCIRCSRRPGGIRI